MCHLWSTVLRSEERSYRSTSHKVGGAFRSEERCSRAEERNFTTGRRSARSEERNFTHEERNFTHEERLVSAPHAWREQKSVRSADLQVWGELMKTATTTTTTTTNTTNTTNTTTTTTNYYYYYNHYNFYYTWAINVKLWRGRRVVYGTSCKNDTTPRYAPSWTNTLRVELHVTDVSRPHPGSMPTVPRPSAGQGRSKGGIGGRSWILIGWSGS